MSTTIYNAFCYKTNDIIDVINFVKSIKKKIESSYIQEQLQTEISSAIDFFDYNFLKYCNDGKFSIPQLKTELNESAIYNAKKEKKIIEDSDTKKQTDIILYPTSVLINNEKHFLFQFFSTDLSYKTISKKLLENQLIKEYDYFNNTDKPKQIPAKQWKERQKNWDIIFAEDSVPAMVGISMQLIHPIFKPYFKNDSQYEILKNEICEFHSSESQQIIRKDKIYKKAMINILEANDPIDKKNLGFSQMMDRYFELEHKVQDQNFNDSEIIISENLKSFIDSFFIAKINYSLLENSLQDSFHGSQKLLLNNHLNNNLPNSTNTILKNKI